MRHRHTAAILIVLLFTALPVSAQQWEVYDTFKAPLINPDLWWSNQGPGACHLALECERVIENGNLRLRIRGFNDSRSNDGDVWSENGLVVANPTAVTGFLARLAFTKAAGTFCSPGGGSMVGQMGLRATLFHSHPDEIVSQPDWYNEVEANIHMYPATDGTIQVGAILRRIGTNAPAYSVDLGKVKLGDLVDIWIRWDDQTSPTTVFFGMQPIRTFSKRSDGPAPAVEEGFDYAGAFPVREASTNPYRVVRLQSSPHNCGGVSIFSDVEVKIDSVSVLR